MSRYIRPETRSHNGRAQWTAEEHRTEARRLLDHAGTDGDTANRLAAAQVHALLALSLRPLSGQA